MLTIDDLNLDYKLAIGIALVFSSEVLPLYEAKYPNDLRPRKAIESAIRWLHNPCEKTSCAAADARTNAAYAAASEAAADAAYYAARAASAAAASAAASAASAASAAYYSASYAASAAAYAYYAVHAGYAADKEKYIHDRILKILLLIIEYKIENKQSFNNAEKVLESLSDEDKVTFLFNLNTLR